jgi:hypothetical protein
VATPVRCRARRSWICRPSGTCSRTESYYVKGRFHGPTRGRLWGTVSSSATGCPSWRRVQVASCTAVGRKSRVVALSLEREGPLRIRSKPAPSPRCWGKTVRLRKRVAAEGIETKREPCCFQDVRRLPSLKLPTPHQRHPATPSATVPELATARTTERVAQRRSSASVQRG